MMKYELEFALRKLLVLAELVGATLVPTSGGDAVVLAALRTTAGELRGALIDLDKGKTK